jgi:hypothetical protein
VPVVVFIVVVMVVILALCGVIVAYVAFPHRGEELPGVPWLGDAMARAADVLPILEEEDVDEDESAYLHR